AIVVAARTAFDADIPVVLAGLAAALRLALEQQPGPYIRLYQRARRGAAGLEDDVDHAAHVLAAVDHRRGPAHDLDALDVGRRQLGDVGGAGAMAVDQHQHLALEIAALAVGRGAADVDRGLPRGPFAHEADRVLGQQVGHRLGRRVGDALLRNDLDGAGDPGHLFG